MRILLVDMGYINRTYIENVEVGIGTLIIAGLLKKEGHKVKYCEKLIYKVEDLKKIVIDMIDYKAEAVAISTRCDNYILSLMLASYVKEINSKVYTVFAGSQATHTDIETITNFKDVDFVIRGEGELTTKELFTALENNFSLDKISGITYRNNGITVRNVDRKLLTELIYIPEYSFLPDEYIEKIKNDMTAFRIEIGRGCPFNCVFCSTNRMWKQCYRLKSVDIIYLEMEEINQKFGVTNFVLEHDSLSANRQLFNHFIKKMKMINQNKYTWKCSSRIDTLTYEDIELLSSAGCREIYFGIETGSKRMQKIYKKGLSFENLPNLLYELTKKNISYICSFICGHPDETIKDFEETIQLMLLCNVFFGCRGIQLHRLCPENGSELYENMKDNLVFIDNQVSDQAVGVAYEYEKEYILNYPTIFACYYSFNICDSMKQIYDATLKYGINWIRFFPRTIIIITQVLKISVLEIMNWTNEKLIEDSINFILSKKNQSKNEEISKIYEYEKGRYEDYKRGYSHSKYRYLKMDLYDFVKIHGQQSIFIEQIQNGKEITFLNMEAEIRKNMEGA